MKTSATTSSHKATQKNNQHLNHCLERLIVKKTTPGRVARADVKLILLVPNLVALIQLSYFVIRNLVLLYPVNSSDIIRITCIQVPRLSRDSILD